MEKKKLSYEQNVQAAILFLNMFDLYVEKKEEILIGDTLKIMTADEINVGFIGLGEDAISITSQTDLGFLTALYETSSFYGLADLECPGFFVQWGTEINYSIAKNDIEKITGVSMIDCTMDTEFGTHFIGRQTLDYLVKENKVMSLKFMLDGEVFDAQFFCGDEHEIIEVRPHDDLNGFINHVIKKGEKYPFQYRKISGIYSAGNKQRHQFISLTMTEKFRKEYDIKRKIHNKIEYKESDGSDNSSGTIIKMGKIMQDLDPDMYEKIEYIRELLSAGNVSLLDSFISVSLGNYKAEEVQALLGTTLNPMKYAGTAKKLYFGKNLYRITGF
jgi:hypothetical protein